MASKSEKSTRSESPMDIDFSVIRTSIEMGHKMIDQILNGIHYGSEEVRNLLREECDFIMECKVCRNLFRSFPNFVAHKRVYCMEYYKERVEQNALAPIPEDEETVVIQPEAPEERHSANKNNSTKARNVSTVSSDIEKVVNKTFDGKSKEYQFYTKVAEDLEKRKFTKVTNTVTLNPIATTSKAVKVIHAKGDKSDEISKVSSPKKKSPVKSNEIAVTGLPEKNKKVSVLAVCADLAKKKVLQDGKSQTISTNVLPLSTRVSSRSRKSSPRKSIEYLENAKSENSKSVGTEEDMDLSEWNEDNSSDEGNIPNNNDEEWLKFCDVKTMKCKICKKTFSTLHNLKVHTSMKHVNFVQQYPCPLCDSTCKGYFSVLARHLRLVHQKPQTYIYNIKKKFRRQKRKGDEEQGNSSSSSSGANPSSPQKDTKDMLSFSTGWKKCDKCGKICWKMKSFYRHYNTCKGSVTQFKSKSANNSPMKSERQNTGNIGQRNNTALLKLQEKLRAGVIQSSSTENVLKTKLKERNVKSESDTKNDNRDKKSTERAVESNAGNTSELFKILTKPLTVQSTTPDLKETVQSKSYNLRPSRQDNDQEEKASGSVIKELVNVHNSDKEETEKMEEDTVILNNGSPAFKKLEERLVREAGLKDTQKTEEAAEANIKQYSTRASQIKSNITEAKEAPETKDVASRIGKVVNDIGKEDNLALIKEQRALRESPEIKQLEEKLIREATVKQYGTRHGSQVKGNVTEAKETPITEPKNVSGGIRKLSCDTEKRDNVVKVKEQKVLRESPEMKQLEEKLTREAFRHDKHAENKEIRGSSQLGRKEEIILGENISLQKETSAEVKKTVSAEINNEYKEPVIVEARNYVKRTSSKEADNRKEQISEKLRQKIASKELAVHESKARSSRSVSRDSDTKSDKSQDQTPEKMHLMTNLSPVSSPKGTAVLPSSPTPSLQSNSGDSYNMKFKMTVQEMAQVVESASLTKFAKERKRKAKSILNTKQAKESQKIATFLSKPMKRQYKKKNIVLRNVYGTRNKNRRNEENAAIHQGSSDDVGLEKTDTFPSNRGEGSISSRDSSRERQNESKRLSREQKRLQNSAGFVEKNFYAVSSSRDSSKDSQSDADIENRRLSREIKRLENSQGFIDKGLHYESDTSVDRERRSLNKLCKNEEVCDASKGGKEGIRFKSKDEHVISKDDNASTSTKPVTVKNATLTKQEDFLNEDTVEMKEKNDEKIKQKNNAAVFKKTVLYVGKDFTEKIKNIQQRKNELNSETVEAPRCIMSESDTEQKRRKHDDESQIYQLKPSRTSVESKTEITLHKKAVKQDKKELNEKDVDVEQNSSGKYGRDEQIDSPKHRTRLATGSIYFDSELLKLSPSKAEKKVAELNKANDANKERHGKDEKFGNELTLVKKRLSLSPKKQSGEDVSKHQRTMSGPLKYYSLSTGVKKCQKCNKTFWKKSSYTKHMLHSTCSDKNRTRLHRKRSLPLSPDGNLLEENKPQSEIRSHKKVKREESTPEKTNGETYNEDKVWEDIATGKHKDNDKKMQRVTRNQIGSAVNTSENTESMNKELNLQVNKMETGNSEDSENKRTLRNLGTGKQEIEHSKVMKDEIDLRKREVDGRSSTVKVIKNNVELEKTKKKQIATELFATSVSTVNKDVKSEVKKLAESESKSGAPDSSNIGHESKDIEVGITKNSVKSQSEKVKGESKSNEKLPDYIKDNASNVDAGHHKKECKKTHLNLPEPMDIAKESHIPETLKESAEHELVSGKDEQILGHLSSVPVTDEIPGPSTSMLSVFSEDSDDDGSDFSGFSEDDLKIGRESILMDPGEHDELEDDLEDIGSDGDHGELSDDPCSDDDTDSDLKSKNQSASTSQRPIRKSAQNRFSHVEEIWVYKEPGKPIVEKTRSVKNREYVVDITNPSKLQCHNSKDVDRLVDEKNLKCKQCETPCTSVSNLRRHVIRHLGWKRYKCKHCAYTCYDMSYCRQHVSRAHGENLTNKNFDKFITDLKKEASKKRAAKRTSTLHKSKQTSFEDDTQNKPKTPGTNTTGQKVITDQSKYISPSVSGSKSNTSLAANLKNARAKDTKKPSDVDDKHVTDSNKVVVADFISKIEGTKASVVKKETPESEMKIKAEESPLNKARMSLAKALHDK